MVLPASADLEAAILEEEADRSYRALQEPVETYRAHPLAYDFDSLLLVSARLHCCSSNIETNSS